MWGGKEDSLQSRTACFTTLHRAWVKSLGRILLTDLEKASHTRAALEDFVSILCMLHPLGMLSDSEVPGNVPSVPLPPVLWPFFRAADQIPVWVVSATSVWVSNNGEGVGWGVFVVGQVVMLTTLVLQDKNLNANPSNRDSASWRVIAAAQLGHGYQSHLLEMHILVKGGRTGFGGCFEVTHDFCLPL